MHQFDLDTELTLSSASVYNADISNNWSINGTPNGGYLMALLARAIREESRVKQPLILTVNYLTRCVPGSASIRVEKLTASKNFERWEARLIQEGKLKALALGTFAESGNDASPDEKTHESGPPELPPVEECIAMPALDQYTLYHHVEVRMTPECSSWMENRLADQSLIQGWVRFHHQRDVDSLGVLLMADAFPPPVMASKGEIAFAWLPTLELSVCLRNPPRSQWLRGTFRTRHITGGILEEDGELWDQGGRLVAVSRQIAQFRKIGR